MKTKIHWINGPWGGRLAVVPRPRGGDWLDDEVVDWKRDEVDVAVSLLTPEEVAELELGGEPQACDRHGIRFLSFPIADRGVPLSQEASRKLLRELDRNLAEAKRVVVHCRQGIGRSGLLAASLLVLTGSIQKPRSNG